MWYFGSEALYLLSLVLISLFLCWEWSFDCQGRGTWVSRLSTVGPSTRAIVPRDVLSSWE